MAYKPLALVGQQLDRANPINRGLAAWWLLNDGSRGKVKDLSDNNISGDITGAYIGGGGNGSAYIFNGAGVIVMTGNPAPLQLTTEFSISAWIKTGQNRSFIRSIIDKSDSSTIRSYWLSVETTGVLAFRISVGGVSLSFTSGKVVDDNKPHHVAATYDGAFVRVYVDGVGLFATAQTGTTGAATNSVRIGSENIVGTRQFIGSISNVRIYNRKLSNLEMSQLYNEPYTGLYTPNTAKYFVQAVAASSARVWAAIFG